MLEKFSPSQKEEKEHDISCFHTVLQLGASHVICEDCYNPNRGDHRPLLMISVAPVRGCTESRVSPNLHQAGSPYSAPPVTRTTLNFSANCNANTAYSTVMQCSNRVLHGIPSTTCSTQDTARSRTLFSSRMKFSTRAYVLSLRSEQVTWNREPRQRTSAAVSVCHEPRNCCPTSLCQLQLTVPSLEERSEPPRRPSSRSASKRVICASCSDTANQSCDNAIMYSLQA